MCAIKRMVTGAARLVCYLTSMYNYLLQETIDLDLALSSFLIYSTNEICDLRHHFFLVRYGVTLLVQHQRP